MIVFDLSCIEGHRFEGWFGSSDDFADQQARGLVACPQCGSDKVAKAPMAPAVPAKGNQREERPAPRRQVTNGEIPPEVRKAMKALARAQAKALENSKWVGDSFAEQSRAMHYGEKDLEAIHGKATLKEAQELLDEGISVAPLPFPVAEPDELN
ncbi:DUF1178 family protein [Altererythrobacter marinus]|uniref:DUF1178 family protein n=1 Tax=Pelagerythrobacter marinus TaxID=538382 RepID=A0ABW9UVN3_9SPHN|nr:DUF1178 family protein [Pelagerythrobacter marinus]MEC9066175.1 DUF1178 family protein [Pseudomonadota bacterium]MXO68016.1 DUF1178 family protein [Pelagerythrobacter marinus]